jgi:hypothetical protein
MSIEDIIRENDKRLEQINKPFNPITGENSTGERVKVEISDFAIKVLYLPIKCLEDKLICELVQCGSISAYCKKKGLPCTAEVKAQITDTFFRLRCKYDFPFWCAMFVYIKNKGGGDDVLFRLTRPQRRFVETLEALRDADKPIRIVLLKARQWGGSTTSQLYMAWLQLVHKVGLNSLIIAHQGSASDEIKDMFDRMLDRYPVSLLHKLSEAYDENEAKKQNVGRSGSAQRVPQRNCKIKIGTAERPDSCRGGDYNLVHLSEVGLWKVTDGKKPEDIVRAACSGVLFQPYTMIVYESTANGTGNFFQREYDDAKRGVSQFHPLFISWFDIDQYSMPFAHDEERIAFADRLLKQKNSDNVLSTREESGHYLWWLWERGATLEAINWYVHERAKYNDHGLMASEFPSDDIEAFVNSGARVFDRYKVDVMRKTCRPPKHIGDVYADGDSGKSAMSNVRFADDSQGQLWVWELPEVDEHEKITNRYLTVVDIGGRSNKADYSVIVVFDRLYMMDGDKPYVVAQWYGHIDMDILSWKAAQIASFYDDSLLVIESNTLETHDRERQVDGDQSHFILNQIKEIYPNLYTRKQSEDEIREGLPRKYGFHTNVATKPLIISNLIKVVRENLYVERDERCIDELLTYERKQNGAYGAIIGKHDDLLMTRAIGLHICFNEMDMPQVVNKQRRFVQRKRVVTEATI